MKVSEFIEFLKTKPQDLLVVHGMYSEQCLLDASAIKVEEFSCPRPDGWVESRRKDKPTMQYLSLPGN